MESFRSSRKASGDHNNNSSSSTTTTTTTTLRTMILTLQTVLLIWTLLVAPAAAKPSENSPSSSSSSSSSSSDGGVVTHYGYYNGGSFYDGGGAGGGYGLADGYLGDFDKEWATMSGRIPRPKCVDIPANMSLCEGIGYEQMMLPNLLQHDTLTEVTQQAKSWVPLVGLHCHPDTRVFLCSLFSPVCLDREIYPCRSLCESVKDHCLQRMIPYGFDWPEMLRCDKFPMDNDMCIRLIHDMKSEADNNCAACKHPMTYEAMIDNYCRAEFVLRVKVKGVEARDSHQALLLKKSRKNFKKGAITRKEEKAMVPLLDGKEGCTCDLVSNAKSRYLIFGNKRDDNFYITYVTEFAKKDKEFKKALRAIRKRTACLGILQGTGLGGDLDDDDDDGKGSKGRKGKKRKKGKKGRKGKKRRKDRKGKKSNADNSDNSA